MADNLPLNQIRPTARSVDSFIRPAAPNVAAPATPQMMPNPQGIRLLPQGSGGSIQGVNQFAELAMALAPLSRGLVELASTGMQMYAKGEYEKGRAEAARAQALANQQMLQSQAQYAGENRKLAQVDPIGAMMMDRVNPYREAGRQNTLARIAGQEINSAVLQRYRNIPGAYELPPGSPELKQLEALAVEEITKKYRVDPASPGFVEHVLPAIGQAGERLYAQHWDDHVKFQKETAWRNAAVEASAIYQQARQTGTVEWMEYDPTTGRPIRRLAQVGTDRAGWERGLQVLIGQAADRLANETGIPGEASTFKRQMFERLAEQAGLAGNTELRRILLNVEAGPVGKDGRRALAGELYGIEMFEANNKIGQSLWQQSQRQTEQGVQQFENELADITFGEPDGPMRGQKINQLVEKYKAMGVPLGKLMEATQGMSKTLDDVAGRSYDPSGTDALLQDMQARVGAAWNARQADKELEASLTGVAPQDREEKRKQYAEIRRAKEKEKDDVPGHLVNPLIDGKIKSRLREFYPFTDLLAWGDADVARSAQLQLSAYRSHVYSRIQEAEAKKGAKLSAAEITSVTTRALEEYGKSDKEALQQLFPGSAKAPNTPSVGNRARPAAPGGAESAPAGRQSFAKPVYPSGQLDNIPDRGARLQSGEPVLALPSVQEEMGRVLNGQPPSAAASRAARDAGYGNNVGRWLLREADNYPSFSIPNDARQQLLRSSRDAQGVADSFRTAMAPARPVQSIAGWFFDALTGATPAVAAPNLAMRQGGSRDGGGPFMGSAPVIGAISINSLRRAIVGKESGGNFAAVNPDSGALGYGQVMPANVASWTQKHYGRRLTPKEFLANREAQLAVVNGQITQIVQQQLAAGYKGAIAIRRAAAIWYSGRGNLYDDDKPQFYKGRRYPSIREYTLDILRRYTQGG